MSAEDIALLRRNLDDSCRDLVHALTRDGKEPLGNVVSITREDAWALITFQVRVRRFRQWLLSRAVRRSDGRGNVYTNQAGDLVEELTLDHDVIEEVLKIKPRHLNDTVVVNEGPDDPVPPVNVGVEIEGQVLDADALGAAIRQHFGEHPPWTCASPVRDDPCEYDPNPPGPPDCLHCGTEFPGAPDPSCNECEGHGYICTCCALLECQNGNHGADEFTVWRACPGCSPAALFRRMSLALT